MGPGRSTCTSEGVSGETSEGPSTRQSVGREALLLGERSDVMRTGTPEYPQIGPLWGEDGVRGVQELLQVLADSGGFGKGPDQIDAEDASRVQGLQWGDGSAATFSVLPPKPNPPPPNTL